jgi:hypothetical protein
VAHPRGRALAHAYRFVFFAGTVVFAMVNGTEDYDELWIRR